MYSKKLFVAIAIFSVLAGKTLANIADSECIDIISRQDWGAAPPMEVRYQKLPVEKVIICHTVTPVCNSFSVCSRQLRAMQSFHQNQKDFNDIAYNFMIGNDGTVYEGVGWHKAGTHTKNYNNVSVAIAFIGDFENSLPSASTRRAAKKLLDCGVEEGELDQDYRLFGHRQLTSTQSPGRKLYKEIQAWDHWAESI